MDKTRVSGAGSPTSVPLADFCTPQETRRSRAGRYAPTVVQDLGSHGRVASLPVSTNVPRSAWPIRHCTVTGSAKAGKSVCVRRQGASCPNMPSMLCSYRLLNCRPWARCIQTTSKSKKNAQPTPLHSYLHGVGLGSTDPVLWWPPWYPKRCKNLLFIVCLNQFALCNLHPPLAPKNFSEEASLI